MKATLILLIWAFTLVITDHLQCSYNTQEIWTNPGWDDMRESSDNCMDNMKDLIQQEMNVAMQYLVMATHFSKDTISRPGFAQMFFEAASDRREQAINLISYLLMRGEIISDVTVPDVRKNSWTNGEEALRDALQIEAAISKKIKRVVKEYEDQERGYNDVNLVDYLTGKILKEQYKIQGDIAGKFSTLSKLMDKHGALGEFIFDKKLFNGEMDHGYEFHGLLSAAPPKRLYVQQEDDLEYKRFIDIELKNGTITRVDLMEGCFEVEFEVLSEVTPADVSFDLYNTEKTKNGRPYTFNLDNFDEATFRRYFDESKYTLIVAHGWQNNRDSPINQLIKGAALSQYNINLIITDWSSYASSIFYCKAKNAMPGVGKIVAELVNKIQNMYSLDGTRFVLIGHSLGAHVVGHAGKNVRRKVEYIAGLDPAAPLFSVNDKTSRLADTDAKYVEVVHTNGALLGFMSAIGSIDYYPNGGRKQAGCGWDLTGTCSHSRAYEYLVEAIIRGPVFIGYLCSDYKSYQQGSCFGHPKETMGQLFRHNLRSVGDYYLKTNPKPPYGRGDEH